MINTYSSLRLKDEGLIPEDTALVLHPQDTVDAIGRTLLMLLRVAYFLISTPLPAPVIESSLAVVGALLLQTLSRCLLE